METGLQINHETAVDEYLTGRETIPMYLLFMNNNFLIFLTVVFLKIFFATRISNPIF